MSYNLPPPQDPKWNIWAEKLNTFLVRNLGKLRFLRGGDVASDDGIMMWSRDDKHPVVSKDGAWHPLSYGHNGHGSFYETAELTAASTNTATPVTWSGAMDAHGIEIDDTVDSRLVFEKSGTYYAVMGAELDSGSASTKTLTLWFRKNGVDVANTGTIQSVHSNGERTCAMLLGIFHVDASDYIECMFSVDNTALTMNGGAATAYSPAAPAARIALTEISHG